MNLFHTLYEEAIRLLTHEFTADQLADPSERQKVHNILIAKIPVLRASRPPLAGLTRVEPPPGNDLRWYQAMLRPCVERMMDVKSQVAGQDRSGSGVASFTPPIRDAAPAQPKRRERRRDPKAETRDKWLYRQATKRNPPTWKALMLQLNKIVGNRGWRKLSSPQAVQQAVGRFIDRNNLAPLEPRKEA